MVYQNFRLLMVMCFMFGIGKLLNVPFEKCSKLNFVQKPCSLALIAGTLLYYFHSTTFVTEFNVHYLAQIDNLNELVMNIFIILLNLISGVKDYKELNDIINRVLNKFKVIKTSEKIMCLRLYVVLTIPLIIFTIVIAVAAIYNASPIVLLFRVPTLLTIIYVCLHLQLISLILNFINQMLSEKILCNKKNMMINTDARRTTKFVDNILKSDYRLRFATKLDKVDLKSLSKMYDDASTCIYYLEKLQGLQIVLAIWLAFSSAVVGVTLIACHEVNRSWLMVMKSVLPFSWFFMACYIQNQLIKEVKRAETLLVKCLIDYRCDETTRNAVHTFKQLIATNRLTFTACNVFRLDYGLILGTVINVITYSIILIQLLLSD